MLRLIRAIVLKPAEAPRVLGVDDFAFRRGQHYGTILSISPQMRDHLLPDRQGETLATWLKEYPVPKSSPATGPAPLPTASVRALPRRSRSPIVFIFCERLRRPQAGVRPSSSRDPPSDPGDGADTFPGIPAGTEVESQDRARDRFDDRQARSDEVARLRQAGMPLKLSPANLAWDIRP